MRKRRILLKTDNTKIITFFYFFLLIYTIAALVWWGMLLHQQNNEISVLKVEELELQKGHFSQSGNYTKALEAIHHQRELRNWQYIGEGVTFLFIILLSAGFVFGAMRRQIRFARQQRNFMLAVTHELKSPIAVIQLNLETLLKRKLPEDKQENFLTKTLAETNRLNRLSNNMLLASQFENRQYQLMKEPINISILLEKMIVEFKNRTHRHLITSQIEPNVQINGDPMMIQIVCSNIIENAMKYAPAESIIHIVLTKTHKEVQLRFEDKGEGVPVEERNKIFDRFYRIGNENTRKSKGTGLGLFLTKKIVLQHGGRVFVMDNNPKGSIFEIDLPLMGVKMDKQI